MIRLLQIRPGYTLDIIECDFLYVDLHSSGQYDALSYTWQQQAPSVPILVNRSMMLTSENLYLALLHLRKRGVTRLWADALCLYLDRSRIKHCKNLWLEPLFCEVFDFAHLACQIKKTHSLC
ncbi:hypothetical protein K469DRAFT_704283 [Zopfia rhizophila CBS 207.26]|uniref:Heterokaryon incompatibility domain-containing protein n=1 Tax=Zopfia rhizophila CBS 207.26 TaxID=1314779 RepID=A0A6A6E877_9PEZI|nr:hypothetical protein K469DRAFT_704283 [Zopfia rhizophila CBS 207.26]